MKQYLLFVFSVLTIIFLSASICNAATFSMENNQFKSIAYISFYKILISAKNSSIISSPSEIRLVKHYTENKNNLTITINPLTLQDINVVKGTIIASYNSSSPGSNVTDNASSTIVQTENGRCESFLDCGDNLICKKNSTGIIGLCCLPDECFSLNGCLSEGRVVLLSDKQFVCSDGILKEKSGILNISSYPEESNLIINDVFAGSTPVSLSLSVGYKKIVLSHYGYSNYSDTVYVGFNNITSLFIELEAVSSTDRINNSLRGCFDGDNGMNVNIKSNVTVHSENGTEIYFDECLSSEVLNERTCTNGATDYVMYTCPFGCRDGKCVYNSSFSQNITGPSNVSNINNTYTNINVSNNSTVSNNTTNTTPVNTNGTLYITSNVNPASVYVNGGYVGTTPLTMSISEGTKQIRVVKQGYVDNDTSIIVYRNEMNGVNANLMLNTTQINTNGTLQVTSNINSASVYISLPGSSGYWSYSGTTPLTISTSEGTKYIKVVKSGYLDNYTQTIVYRNEVSDVNANLMLNTTPINTNGTLQVTSNINSASVYISPLYSGYRIYSGTTPLTISTSEGTKDIKVVKSGYDDYYTSTTVYRNEVSSVYAMLNQTTNTTNSTG